jgi:hypothetical protein
MITINKEQLQRVIGGRGGHGEVPGPEVDGCMFNAISKAGRIVDSELPASSHSEAERQKRFLELRDGFAAECRNAKRAK